jgi:hypothetical protein
LAIGSGNVLPRAIAWYLVDPLVGGQGKGQQTPHASPARKIAAPIEGDHCQPRTERASFIKVPKGPMGREEDVLHRVQSIVSVAQACERKTIEHVTVPSHNLTKGPVSTGYAERDELAVGKLVKLKAHDYLR